MLKIDDIICYVPIYNDVDTLRRLIGKMSKIGIKLMVVDSRFTDFPQINDSDLSTDGTRELCLENDVIYLAYRVSREEEKFNFALRKAREMGYEVFMYCGADAYYEADVPEFLLSLQRYYEQYAVEPTQLMIFCEEKQPQAKWNNTGTRQPRLILNYWKMEARHLHWAMFEKGAPDTRPLAPINEVIDGIKLFHDNSARPKERDDMMTDYQDINVPRERAMFLNNIVPKAFDELNIMQWNLGKDGTYEEARHKFFRTPDNYSHLIVIADGYELNDENLGLFKDILTKRNNLMQQLPLITAVWASKTKKGNFTLNPDGKINAKWPKYPKIEALYSQDGLPVEKDTVLVVPYTAGPIVCMNRRVVELVENMGDDLDFLAILMGLGVQMHAESRIQL